MLFFVKVRKKAGSRAQEIGYIAAMLHWKCFLGLAWVFCTASLVHPQQRSSVFAFGAGNHPGASQSTWLNVLETTPDYFFWAGSFSPGSPVSGRDLERLLQKQAENKHYRLFADSIPISGSWYWTTPPLVSNDSLDDWHRKWFSFVKGPNQAWPGKSYWAQWLVFGKDSVQCIFLDTWRFARPGEPDNNLLGEEQWNWLEQALNQPHKKLRLIFTAKSFFWEQDKGDSWHSFPPARARFAALLEKAKSPLLLVSGSHPCAAVATGNAGKRRVVELQTNGLNQVRWRLGRTPEKAAIIGPYCQRNFGLLTISWNAPVSLKYQIIDLLGFEVEQWTAYLGDL
jgi:hypothetical protein